MKNEKKIEKRIETKTNKLVNSFRMLKLLKENGRTKGIEIVRHLDLKSRRSINYLKDTLEFLGYNIKSYGGYEGGLEYIPDETLSDEEILIISEKLGGENSSLIEKIKRVNKIREAKI